MCLFGTPGLVEQALQVLSVTRCGEPSNAPQICNCLSANSLTMKITANENDISITPVIIISAVQITKTVFLLFVHPLHFVDGQKTASNRSTKRLRDIDRNVIKSTRDKHAMNLFTCNRVHCFHSLGLKHQ